MKLEFEEINILASKLAKIIKKGELIALIGDLGTGKTHFTKSIAKSLGIKENITSPTFTYVKEYNYENGKLFHFDVYRLSSADELYEIGYEDYLNQNALLIIEWADIIKEELPKEYLQVNIKYAGESSREIAIAYVNNSKREKEILDYVGFSNR